MIALLGLGFRGDREERLSAKELLDHPLISHGKNTVGVSKF
jgi:hypothetical protein